MQYRQNDRPVFNPAILKNISGGSFSNLAGAFSDHVKDYTQRKKDNQFKQDYLDLQQSVQDTVNAKMQLDVEKDKKAEDLKRMNSEGLFKYYSMKMGKPIDDDLSGMSNKELFTNLGLMKNLAQDKIDKDTAIAKRKDEAYKAKSKLYADKELERYKAMLDQSKVSSNPMTPLEIKKKEADIKSTQAKTAKDVNDNITINRERVDDIKSRLIDNVDGLLPGNDVTDAQEKRLQYGAEIAVQEGLDGIQADMRALEIAGLKETGGWDNDYAESDDSHIKKYLINQFSNDPKILDNPTRVEAYKKQAKQFGVNLDEDIDKTVLQFKRNNMLKDKGVVRPENDSLWSRFKDGIRNLSDKSAITLEKLGAIDTNNDNYKLAIERSKQYTDNVKRRADLGGGFDKADAISSTLPYLATLPISIQGTVVKAMLVNGIADGSIGYMFSGGDKDRAMVDALFGAGFAGTISKLSGAPLTSRMTKEQAEAYIDKVTGGRKLYDAEVVEPYIPPQVTGNKQAQIGYNPKSSDVNHRFYR